MTPRNVVPTHAFDNGIRIVPFERFHQERVIELFKSGLQSYVGPGSVDPKGLHLLIPPFLEEKLEKDMKDVYGTYMQGVEIPNVQANTEKKENDPESFNGLCFFSALDPDEKIVGCVGVKAVSSSKADDGGTGSQANNINNNVSESEICELVRMSVRDDCRGLGVGKKLVGVVEKFAVTNGYKRICLSTLNEMKPAVALYKSCGFAVEKEDLIPMKEFGDNSSVRVVYFIKDV